MQGQAIPTINLSNRRIKCDQRQPLLLFGIFRRINNAGNSMSHFLLSDCYQPGRKGMLQATNETVEIFYGEEGASHAGN